MSDAKITFYVDVISPFAYLAHYMLRTSPVFKDVNVTYVPIGIGALHKLCSNTAPLFIKNKGAWINKERLRWADTYAIPTRPSAPPGFPMKTNPTLAMRALTYILAHDQSAVPKVLDLFFAAIWNHQGEILAPFNALRKEGEFVLSDKETVTAMLASVVGDQRARDAVAGAAGMKDAIVQNTQAAFESGAFGLPWLVCEKGGEKEGFWGFDHMGQVVRFLGLDEDGDLGRSGRKMRPML